MTAPHVRFYPPGVPADFVPPATTVPEILGRSRARFAERRFLSYNGQGLTYGQFGALVDRAAAGLRALGVGPGIVVGLHLPNTPHYPIAFFAVLKAGGTVANFSPLDAKLELRTKIERSEPRFVISFAGLHEKLPQEAGAPRIILCQPDDFAPAVVAPADGLVDFRWLIGSDHPEPDWPERHPDDLAVLQFTGGTTGLPKAAMLTHGNVTAAMAIYSAWFTAGTGDTPDRMICVLPLFHIYGLSTMLLSAMSAGSELILKMRWDTEDILETIARERPTTFMGVPSMYVALTSHPKLRDYDLSSLQRCVSGGAPLAVELQKSFGAQTGQKLLEGWGMSETCSAGTGTPETMQKSGAAGIPLPGVTLEIRDLATATQRMPQGEPGEVCISGPNVFRGYYKDVAATEEVFVGSFFRTGDIGYLDEDGFLHLVDRRKDLIISGGYNVYPRMVEEAIYAHPGVEEVAVIGIPDAYRGESAKAFIKLREGASPFTLAELKTFLADRVGPQEMPTEIEFRPELPKTAVGKLSKKELRTETGK